MFCSECGAEIHDKAIACPKCGCRVARNRNSLDSDEKTRMLYIILGIFLGGLGVHNFYAGRIGCGVAQLLISLLTLGIGYPFVFIWVIIELCTVTKDGSGKPFARD